MPEGDTIFRTADTLRRWLVGRAITDARTRVPDLAVGRLVGQRVTAVEPQGKHLLIRFSSGEVLHTHMRMSGSWHAYSADEAWHRPEYQARLVLQSDGRVAVCFNAPVIELLAAGDERAHPALAGLGPDVLVEPLDLDEVRRRARTRPPETAVGELLLDQQVLSGVGNVYRCEVLFVCGLHPQTPAGALDDETLDVLVITASRLMRANVGQVDRDVGTGRPGHHWVYKRARRPCRRCGTAIVARRLGESARTAWWCPTCQPQPQTTVAPHGAFRPYRD